MCSETECSSDSEGTDSDTNEGLESVEATEQGMYYCFITLHEYNQVQAVEQQISR